ncbi:MAG: response regulator transcription factor [Magnetococcales bacterium]|nr:response regulator transcription factor [Magnetococcales bacterium]
MTKDRILIIEDEEDLNTTLEYNLKREGYDTISSLTGEDGLRLALKEPYPDLVVLDLMLPGIYGIEVCRRLRDDSRTRSIPVLILTAKSEEIDKVIGFEVGADDYVVKPFQIRELLLRIRAILRRTKPDNSPENRTTNFGFLTVDHDAHRVWVQQKEVFLTNTEFKMLCTFLARRGQVKSRDKLLSEIWGVNSFVQTRTVDAHVKCLREKLGEAGKYVETIWGVGYRFCNDPEPDETPESEESLDNSANASTSAHSSGTEL